MTIDGKLSAYDAIKTAAEYQGKTIESAVRMLVARRQHPINSRTFRCHLETGTARFVDVKHTMKLLGFKLKWVEMEKEE